MSSTQKRKPRTPAANITIEAMETIFGIRVIAFRPELAALGVGTPRGPLGAKGGLFLSQAFYWAKTEADENGYFPKPQTEIFAVTGLNDEEQKTIRDECVLRGYLFEDKYGRLVTTVEGRQYTGPAQLHYKLGLEAIHRDLETLITQYPLWTMNGEQSVEAIKQRKAERNAKDRARRARAKRALAEQGARDADEKPETEHTETQPQQQQNAASGDANQKRVSEKPGYAFSPDETAENDEMRIRETRKRAPENGGDAPPEKSENLYIDSFRDASGQKHNGENDDFDRAFDDDAAGSEMRVVVDVSNSQNDADAETDLANRLIAEGVSIDAARQFAREKSEIAERQLKYLPYRPEKPANEGGNRGGLLAASIRAGYPPPGPFLDQQRAAAEREKNRPALEARQAALAARDAEQVAANESAAQLFERLDAVWGRLDADDRALVEKTALKSDPSGFLADRIQQRGEIPLLERRATIEMLLQERLLIDEDFAQMPEAAPTPQNAPPSRAEAPTAPAIETPAPMAAHAADMFWDALDPMARKNIDREVDERLISAPATEKTDAARIELKRALIVDLWARLMSGTNENEADETGEPQPKTA